MCNANNPAPARPSVGETRTALGEAAALTNGLWLSYLFVLFYMLVATGSVTHRDLFLESPVQLPFLSSLELPLTLYPQQHNRSKGGDGPVRK